jgi:hypothetical protein
VALGPLALDPLACSPRSLDSLSGLAAEASHLLLERVEDLLPGGLRACLIAVDVSDFTGRHGGQTAARVAERGRAVAAGKRGRRVSGHTDDAVGPGWDPSATSSERRSAMGHTKHAQVGDQIVIHGHRLGEPARTGEILEVLAAAGNEHYRVRWDDGREALFYPGDDAIVRPARHAEDEPVLIHEP